MVEGGGVVQKWMRRGQKGELTVVGRNQNKSTSAPVLLALHAASMMEGVLSDLMEIIPCGCWQLTQSQSILQKNW
eukprot:scaffold2079_cov77-Skeletonema_dohrnii-CCMP3373.AAC.3